MTSHEIKLYKYSCIISYTFMKTDLFKLIIPVNLKSCHPWLGVENISLEL